MHIAINIFTKCFYYIYFNAIYPVFIICTILILILIYYYSLILNALCNLLGKLDTCLVYLHYVLCTVAFAMTTLGKIRCIFYKVIVNKYLFHCWGCQTVNSWLGLAVILLDSNSLGFFTTYFADVLPIVRYWFMQLTFFQWRGWLPHRLSSFNKTSYIR